MSDLPGFVLGCYALSTTAIAYITDPRHPCHPLIPFLCRSSRGRMAYLMRVYLKDLVEYSLFCACRESQNTNPSEDDSFKSVGRVKFEAEIPRAVCSIDIGEFMQDVASEVRRYSWLTQHLQNIDSLEQRLTLTIYEPRGT